MRSKKINYRNGATGVVAIKANSTDDRTSFYRRQNNVLPTSELLPADTASATTAVGDVQRDTVAVQKSEIGTQRVTTPTTPATPKAVPVDTPEVAIVGQEVPSAMVGSGSSSSITTEQPEKTVKKDYTRLILQVVIAAFAIHWLRTNL